MPNPPKPASKSILAFPFLPVLLAPFILLSPVLLSGQALFWGTPLLQFVPWWSWSWEILQSGHLPLWNPLAGMGTPLLANYQSALIYPPNWLYFLLASFGGLSALAWGQALLVAVHLAWGGLGMSMLARKLGLGLLAQTITGLAFGLCGYFVSRSGFLSINAAVAWLPWIILSLTFAFLSPVPWGSFLALVVCLAMQLLAGHAQTAWYTLLLAGMWAFFWGWKESSRQENESEKSDRFGWLWPVLRAELWLGLAIVFAFCLAAVQLLPVAEYLSQSHRAAAVDYEMAMTYSFWPWHLVALFAPDMFGNPARGDYWGYANYWEDAIYIGFLPVLFAIGTILGNIRRRGRPDAGTAPVVRQGKYRALVLFLFGLILLAFLLALGKNTPVFPWLYTHVPTFSLFQAPARYLIWTEFSLALLAGIGMDAWQRPEDKKLIFVRLATVGAFGVLIGAGAGWLLLGEVSPSFIRATALAGFWGAGTGILALLAPASHAPPTGAPVQASRLQAAQNRWSWAVVLFVAADLLLAGWGLNPGVELSVYAEPSPTKAEVQSLSGGNRIYLPEADEQALKFRRFLRFKTFTPKDDWRHLRAALLPNVNMLDRIPSANNFDPLLPGRYRTWMSRLERSDPQTKSRLFDVMGVGLLEQVGRAQEYGVRWKPVESSGRWRWVACARRAEDEKAAMDLVFSGQVDFRSEVVLEGIGRPDPPGCRAAKMEPVEITFNGGRDPNRLEFHLNAPASGWFVLSDVWYPGWKAWVDGEPAEIFRANYLFRAVPVEAGEHEIVFVYRPASFRLGLLTSLTSLIFVGVIMFRYAYTKSSNRSTGDR